jgi:CDP-diacylglycerol--glycerol-3-phosphate 3-phosphatidyltransferase
MALPGREDIRAALSRYVEVPGAKCFRAVGLTPNAITLIGFAVCVAAAYLVSNGWLLAGGIVFLVGGSLDMFDGALARMSGKASPFGALMDSVFDRLGEAALFVGLGLYFMGGGFDDGTLTMYVLILLLALVFSQGVSYLRARGEGLGAFTRDGVMTRTERVIILGVGLIADGLTTVPLMPWILLVIAVVSGFTLFQRMWAIKGLLEKGS